MINLKISKADKVEYSQPVSPDPMEYPYGLQINLDEETLKKLGVKNLPDVEATFTIRANVKVISRSEHESVEGGERRCLGLQVTDLDLGLRKKEIGTEKIYNK